MNKNLIFLSHATPQDNYFASWLCVKLKALGYNVWLDLEDISAGDSFNTVIKPIIKQKAKVFIAITTKEYAAKSSNQNSGVSRELNCAATVNTNDLGHNFILPIKVDDIEYNDFPFHYAGWSSTKFTGNWKNGLVNLVHEFERLNISKNNGIENPINLWFESIKVQNEVIHKEEKYYTNWLKINLPQSVFIHLPDYYNPVDIYKIPFPLIIESNRIISFTSEKTIKKYVSVHQTNTFSIEQFTIDTEINIDSDFTLKEPRKKLIWLLNKAFEDHLRSKGLVCWLKGKKRKRRIFYFKNSEEEQKYVNLARFGKPRGRRALTGVITEKVEGKAKKINWHFALKGEASLDPLPHYRLFYSIIFTDENFKRLDTYYQMKFRRKIPSDWFNRKWFETLLAAILRISPDFENNNIEISIDDNMVINVNNEPLNSISEFGYNEPG